MIVKVGGYYFALDKDTSDVTCLRNKNVIYCSQATGIRTREELIDYAEHLAGVLDNVPEEFLFLLDSEDLEESEI